MPDSTDNCKDAANANQADADGDGIGDACDDTVQDTTAPEVTRVVPVEDATGIGPGTNVAAFFSEAMRVGSINANPVKLFRAGTQIDAVVSYDAEKKKAILNPNASLQLGAKYKAVVTTGAKDLAGNRLDQDPSATGTQPKQWFSKVRN